MIEIFAQVPEATPVSIGNWLIDLAAVAAIALIFLKIADHFKEKKGVPQPLIVTAQPSFADKAQTEERFKHLESKIEGARLENKTEMEKLRVEAVEGRRGLHHDIRALGDRLSDRLGTFSVEVTNKVGELRGEVRQLTKTGKTSL